MITRNNTTISQRAGMPCVTLYATNVVAFDAARIVLKTGGHVTATTAKRMAQASKAFNLDLAVSRKDGEMVIVYKGKKYTFTDTLTLNRN